MEFRDGANYLRAIIAPNSGGDIERLLGRVEEIRLALERRAGVNTHQQELVSAAVNQVVDFLSDRKYSHPVVHEEKLLRALEALAEAGS
jgi:hypothetical protein